VVVVVVIKEVLCDGSCYVDGNYIGDVMPVSVSCATFDFLL
jgi:hypothetical protein